MPRPFEDEFNEALRLRDAGDLPGAADSFRELAERFPEEAAIWGTFGSILFDQSDFSSAIAAFRRAAELSPKSELASISLFHSLLACGRQSEAWSERERFLGIMPGSEEYAVLDQELLDAGIKPGAS